MLFYFNERALQVCNKPGKVLFAEVSFSQAAGYHLQLGHQLLSLWSERGELLAPQV